MKKVLMLLLMLLCFTMNTVFAALPTEGVYELRNKNNFVQARMYVMGAQNAKSTAYTFGYGNEHAEVIWLECYLDDGSVWSQVASKYIWKTDDAGALETALILDRDETLKLERGEMATPRYGADVGAVFFEKPEKKTARVNIDKSFRGVPASWDRADVSSQFNGVYRFVGKSLKFTPLSAAYAMESTSNLSRFYNAEATNQEWNQGKVRLELGKDGYYNLEENLMELGRCIRMKVKTGDSVEMMCNYGRGILLGDEVRFRDRATLQSKTLDFLRINEEVTVEGLVEGFDGNKWYYVTRKNGDLGFVAAQYVELR